ncbi:DUF5627 domain-containing protein [Membranihabitans marinus]|uniref:DUF5627 domain-containing protein n=1 Tax=Membranihabitans marinus TaxID=1227546 RepID=UPI001F19BD6B|nr:DUF5627 domain-containing protein [Membranihabitans marinus]
MKRILLYILIIFGFLSCENFEIEHPDFDYTSGFFPYQFPVRTLVLGDYIYDNSNDNNHKFIISAAMGGVYENDKDRSFQIEVDNSLCDNIMFNSEGDTIYAMPSNYYSLSNENSITIPKGEFNGGIEVQLTDAFFNDEKAIKLGYVVPIRLKSSNDVDSILNGSSSNPNADPRLAGQWTVAPKNFTMFAVKYINEYHGTYFHYGQSTVKDSMGMVLEDTTYSENFVVNNTTSKLVTTGRNSVEMVTSLRSTVMTGEVKMVLTFEGDNCTIAAAEGSDYEISGTGAFQSNAYEWGNKDRNGIVLNYTVSDGNNTLEASEVLVDRDRGVVLEVYSPEVY